MQKIIIQECNVEKREIEIPEIDEELRKSVIELTMPNVQEINRSQRKIQRQEAINNIVKSENKNAILYGPLEIDTGEEVKVYTKNGIASRIGKRVKTSDICVGEAVGIIRYSKQIIPTLLQTMNNLFEKNPLAEHEDLTQLMCDKGIMDLVSTNNLPWIEIDFLEDIEKARVEIIKEIENA